MKFLLIFLLFLTVVHGKKRPECNTYDKKTGVKTKEQCKSFVGIGTYDSCYYVESVLGKLYGGCAVSTKKEWCDEKWVLKELDLPKVKEHYCCKGDLCNAPEKINWAARSSSTGKNLNRNFAFVMIFLLVVL